jgi:hypothetical protein
MANKHFVAKTAEKYTDHVSTLVGTVAVAAAVGFISLVIGPDAAGGSLFDLAGAFFSLSGYTITWGMAVGALTAALAYGSNQTLDAVVNAKDSWKETEGLAALFAVGFPLALAVPAVAGVFTGDVTMQGIGTSAYAYAMFHLNNN